MNKIAVAQELVKIAKSLTAENWEDYLVPLNELSARREELLEQAKHRAHQAIEFVKSSRHQLSYEAQHVSDYLHSGVSMNVRHLNLVIPPDVLRKAEAEMKEWTRTGKEIDAIIKSLGALSE